MPSEQDVFVYIKIPEAPAVATQKGDIVYIIPPDIPQAKDSYITFMPVKMKLKIPCGDNFKNLWLSKKGNTPCLRCQYFDPDECDVRKYTLGTWSPGDIDNPPDLIHKHKYFIDRAKFLSAESEGMLVKPNKTTEEMNVLFEGATKNERTTSDIEEKV